MNGNMNYNLNESEFNNLNELTNLTKQYYVTLNPLIFCKLLKTLKFTTKIFIKIKKEQLKITAVDFKEYLGLVECIYKLNFQNNVNYEKNISLDLDLLIKSLDSFKETISLCVNEEQKYVTIRAASENLTEKHFYLLPFEDGLKISNILELDLLTDKTVLAEFKVKADYLWRLLKHMAVIDSNITFKFLKKDNQYKLSFYAKKTNTIFEDLQQESKDAIYEAQLLSKNQIEEYRVYFNLNYYLNILKLEDAKATFLLRFYNEYLIFEKIKANELIADEFKYFLYIPIKE